METPTSNLSNPTASQDSAAGICENLPTKPLPNGGKILVTGASGYIGGRLVPELLIRGYTVRVMVRADPSVYAARWPEAEVVQSDALRPDSLKEALQGIDVAYYLIHSLSLGPERFEAADLAAATNFKDIAAEQGIDRIIYLGGITDCTINYSRHLKSRFQVGETLRSGSVPVTTLRAAIIIGSGSASYEMIRHLATRLSFLPVPSWAENRCQPIAIRDVIKYLVGVLETPETARLSFDIAGEDILTYRKMLEEFATVINKKLVVVRMPLSSVKLYSYLASLMTPVPARIVGALMEGLRDEAICGNDIIREYIQFTPLSYREAIVRALIREERDSVATRWSDAYPPANELAMRFHELPGGPTYCATYARPTRKGPDSLFGSIRRIGGRQRSETDWLWNIRGMIDKLLLGVGTARGRKRYSDADINDVIDFWRVEAIGPKHRMLLRAEMRLPGKAWLEFRVDDEGEFRKLSATTYFWTDSLAGKMYWYVFLPFHYIVFRNLLGHLDELS